MNKRLISVAIAMSLVLTCIMGAVYAQENDFKFFNYGNCAGEISGDASSLMIKSNGADVWGNADDAAVYLSDAIPFIYDECSTASVEAEWGGITGTDGNPAGAGVMMRAENTDDAVNVMLRGVVKSDGAAPGIQMTYRSSKGGTSSYKEYHINNMTHLRLTRKGNVFTAEAKSSQGWSVLGSITVDMGKEIYVGVAAYSRNTNNFTEARLKNIKIDKSDDYNPSDFADYNDTEQLSQDVLLRENFEDGSLLDGEASVRNPIWDGASQYISTYKDESGNHWLQRNNIVGSIYAGNLYMTDYELSADIIVEPSLSESADNTVMLIGRRKNTRFYSNNFYQVGFTSGNKLSISRVGFWGERLNVAKECASVVIGNYVDGEKRNLRIRFWDNKIMVWINGELKLQYTDELVPLTYGSIGIYTGVANVKIDNIYVRKFNDVLGGDYDNYLRGGFDMETNKIYSMLNESDKKILKERWKINLPEND